MSLLKRKRWRIDDLESGVHVWPFRDKIGHDLGSLDCVCGPKVEWVDAADGETYPNGPLVVHFALDGRK